MGLRVVRRQWLAGVLLAGLLVGCDDAPDQPRLHDTRPSPTEFEAPAQPGSDRTLERPACEFASVPERGFLRAGWERRSTRIGPIAVLDTRSLARRVEPGRSVRKLMILIPPSRELTIRIAADTARRVAFVEPTPSVWSGYAADLHPALRVRNCPRIPPEAGDLPAGQHYALAAFVVIRRRACVPLTVTRNGNRGHRGVISFGAGDCGARSATR